MAKKADGSLRDAISILDQCIAQHNTTQVATLSEIKQLFGDIEDNVIIELASAIENANVIHALNILHKQYYDGRDLKSLLNSLYQYYFQKFTIDFGTTSGDIFERYARILGETMSSLDHSGQKVIITEIAFIKMCKPEMEQDYNSVVQRMNNLEHELTLLKSGNVSVMSNNVSIRVQETLDESVTLYYNTPCNYKLNIL